MEFKKLVDLKDKDLKAKALLKEGVALGNLWQNEEALKACEKATEINPKDPEAWNNKGIILSILGRFEEALKAFKEAIKINPTNPDVWSSKGATLADLGRFDEAFKACEKAQSEQ